MSTASIGGYSPVAATRSVRTAILCLNDTLISHHRLMYVMIIMCAYRCQPHHL
jgi:hypothetical protein